MKVTVTKQNESVIYNGVIYTHGKSFDADEQIAKSLIERGYVEAEEAAPDVEDEADMQTGYLDAAQLAEMPYPELKRLAAQMGVDATGKKEELIARICAVEVGIEDEAVVESEEDEPAGDLPNTSMPE